MSNKIYNIAVIGSGPSGIAVGLEATYADIDDVVVFEKSDTICSMVQEFYKKGKRVDKEYRGCSVEIDGNIDFEDGKSKEYFIEYCEKLLNEKNVNLQYKSNVYKIENKDGLFFVYYNNEVIQAKNVVIGIGKMGKPNKPNYKLPISLKQYINFNANDCVANEKILVVGGGDSATEYAYDLRNTSDVTLACRRDLNRANDLNKSNIDKAQKSNEINLMLGVDISSVQEGESKKIKVNFANDTSEEFDRVIYALGGQNFLLSF